MWRFLDGNKIVGTQIKVESYMNHQAKLRNAKSHLKLDPPYRPSFSISRHNNRYAKFTSNEIARKNSSLLKRMIHIEGEPMRMTLNNIPKHVPSNKENYAYVKDRARRAEMNGINRQNSKILSKIQGAQSSYSKENLECDWREIKKYRANISRKESIPDYSVMAKEYQTFQKSISRPRTACLP